MAFANQAACRKHLSRQRSEALEPGALELPLEFESQWSYQKRCTLNGIDYANVLQGTWCIGVMTLCDAMRVVENLNGRRAEMRGIEMTQRPPR